MGSSRWLCLVSLCSLAAAQEPTSPPPGVTIEGVMIPATPPAKQDEPRWISGGGCDAPEPQLAPDSKPLVSRKPPRNGSLMSPHFSGGTGFYPLQGAVGLPSASAAAPAKDALLQLTISGPDTLPSGKPLKLGVHFRNRSQQPLFVLRPNDGSLEHMRYPHYDLFLQDQKSGQVYRWAFMGGRCGNINPTRAEDHVSIAPGSERADVATQWADYLQSATIPLPGTYRVWLAYRFCSYEERGIPLGKNQQMSGVFKGAIVSNILQVVVR